MGQANEERLGYPGGWSVANGAIPGRDSGERPEHPQIRLPIRRAAMAKGQQRSNREKKKPKQAKKPAAPTSSFTSTPARPGEPAPGKKR
jgi:hypothetical protein